MKNKSGCATWLCGALRARTQGGEEAVWAEGVEDIAGDEPRSAQLASAVFHLVELARGVGVGVDDDFAA